MNDRDKTGPGADGRKPGPTSPPGGRAARRMQSCDLLGDGGQLTIEHAGREYRLRITSNGKLILTA